MAVHKNNNHLFLGRIVKTKEGFNPLYPLVTSLGVIFFKPPLRLNYSGTSGLGLSAVRSGVLRSTSAE